MSGSRAEQPEAVEPTPQPRAGPAAARDAGGRLARARVSLIAITAANADGAVYGALIIGVLLATDDARREGYGATIEAAAVVLLLYWLTGLYSHTLGIRLRRRAPLNPRLVWRSCLHELPLVEGAVVPVLALLVAWAAGLAVGSGVTAALWVTAAVVVTLEIVAGWRARGQKHLWLQALAGAAMGLTLIGIKVVLHH